MSASGRPATSGSRTPSGSCVVMLNPDTELVDASLDELAAFALRRRALAGPRLLNPDGSVQPSASGTPVGPWPWIGAIIPGRLQPGPLRDRTEPWRAAPHDPRRMADRGVRRGAARRPARAGAVRSGHPPVLRGHGPRPARSACGHPLLLLPGPLPGRPSRRRLDLDRVPEWRRPAGRREPPRGRATRLRGRRERASWLAQRVNLRLRVAAKRALGRDASADREALEGDAERRPGPQPPGALGSRPVARPTLEVARTRRVESHDVRMLRLTPHVPDQPSRRRSLRDRHDPPMTR